MATGKRELAYVKMAGSSKPALAKESPLAVLK
jgi:hypothetical protein